jgi:hypothetical protein
MFFGKVATYFSPLSGPKHVAIWPKYKVLRVVGSVLYVYIIFYYIIFSMDSTEYPWHTQLIS